GAVTATSSSFIQCDDAPPQIVPLGPPDVTWVDDPKKNEIVIAFRGKPWVTVNYPKKRNERVDFNQLGWNREQLMIKVKSPKRLRVTIDLDVERELRA